MSYTGENGNGKKYIHAIVTENQEVTLDDISVRIGSGTNNRIVFVRSITSTHQIWAINIFQQNSSFLAPSLYNVTNTFNSWVRITNSYWYNQNGSTQKVMLRTDLNANNRGFYQITVVAGIGNDAVGFNKFSLLIERL